VSRRDEEPTVACPHDPTPRCAWLSPLSASLPLFSIRRELCLLLRTSVHELLQKKERKKNPFVSLISHGRLDP
jgi:hypothetical protein